MEKQSFFVFTVCLLCAGVFLCAGCSRRGVSFSVPDADDVTIFYSYSSYAMFGTDPETLALLKNMCSDLTLTPVDRKLDLGTAFTLYFSRDGEQTATISVDEAGIFQLNGSAETMRLAGGAFDYTLLKNIYEQSKGP